MEASFGVQLGPAHMHTGPTVPATNYESLIAPNRWPRFSHRKHLTLVCTRVPPKRPRTNTPCDHLQRIEQDPINFTSSIFKGRSCQVPKLLRRITLWWSALAQQLTHHGGVETHSQPA